VESKKEDVLKQLNEIKGALVDNSKFVPYNGNMLIIWGVIGGLMLYFAPVFFRSSIISGVIFLAGGFFVGFMLELNFTQKENKKYQLEQFTVIQKSIEYSYAAMMLFALLLTTILLQVNIKSLIYPIWIFAIGFAGLVTGFLVNNKAFKIVSVITLLISLSMFGYVALNIDIVSNQAFADLGRVIAATVLVISYVYLGIDMNKRCLRV